jgi:DNA-binding winged helix-turn-helix (wHTH) protein/tetratricopeptide (TPR) repeat protein
MRGEELYLFGPFALDAAQRVLLREDGPLRLTPREVDVLVALVERHGEIVDKNRLLEQVWRGVSVEECNLSQHVAALRRVLGDDAREPIYIETVPRRGYRFVAPVARAARPRDPSPAPPAEAASPELPPSAAEPPPAEVPPPPPATPSTIRGRRSRTVQATFVALAALGLGWGLVSAHARSTASVIGSIAVLPLANLTGDAHQEHVAETLTRTLLSDLRRASGLRVEAARAPVDGHRVAGVDAFVETALLSGEGRLRVAAELIDTRTDKLVWAEIIDADPVAFLEAGDRIVRAILTRLEGRLGRDGEDPPSGDRAAARREYALARQYLSRRTPQVVEESLEHFAASVKLDPTSALALAGLAEAYLLGAEQRVLAPGAALSEAEAAARRALELDPGLAEAHAALGEIAAARWDFEAAEASYRRALTLDPSIANVHERYAALLTVQDRHEEAIAEARVARDLAPTCPAASTTLASAYYHAGRNDAAIEQGLAALRLTPRFAAAYDVIGWAHQAMGHAAEAVAAFGEAVRLSGRSPAYVAALARAHALAGARKEARQLLSELERSAPGRAASPLDLAEVLAALGETDEALRQFERAAAEGAPWLRHVDAGLGLAALHDHARFRELRGRLHRAAPPATPAPDGMSASGRGPVLACDRPGKC